jgi:hypothetical protein
VPTCALDMAVAPQLCLLLQRFCRFFGTPLCFVPAGRAVLSAYGAAVSVFLFGPADLQCKCGGACHQSQPWPDGDRCRGAGKVLSVRAFWRGMPVFSALLPCEPDALQVPSSAAGGLHRAAGSSHLAAVPCAPACANRWRCVRLCSASGQGHLEEVQRLLGEGVACNQADYDGRTALHIAACDGHAQVCEVLLAAGA